MPPADHALSIVLTALDDVSDELLGAFGDPQILYGIPLALIGAMLMAFGAFYQHRGVVKVDGASIKDAGRGLDTEHMVGLARRPSWWVGTGFLGLAVVFQLAALAIAPLIVVQPVGAVALIFTVFLSARMTGVKPTGVAIGAIIACLIGVASFVTLGALYATEHKLTHRELYQILIVLAVCVVLALIAWLSMRGRTGPLFFIVVGGGMYGFVATLAKAVLSRVKAGEFDWLTLVCMLALVGALIVGTYFVQTAYASGSPDLVVAGLTVIDPIVAVLIALLVLREAVGAPLGAQLLFPIAGALAVWGVWRLAHSETRLRLPESDAATG